MAVLAAVGQIGAGQSSCLSSGWRTRRAISILTEMTEAPSPATSLRSANNQHSLLLCTFHDQVRLCLLLTTIMKIFLMTFTTVFTTSNILFVLATLQTDGLQRHMRGTKGSGMKRMDSESSIASLESVADAGGSDPHRLEKRSFYGRGTFFQPGQGNTRAIGNLRRLIDLYRGMRLVCVF